MPTLASTRAGVPEPPARTPKDAGQPRPFTVEPGDQAATDQVEGWFRTFAASGDPELRERIICAHLNLADRLAARYRSNRSTSFDDLRQVARLGLVQAVDGYDVDRPTPFVPYAIVCVLGTIKCHLRDASWSVHVPRPAKELAMRLCAALDWLPQHLGRSPTVAELAAHLQVTEEEILEAMEAARTRAPPSLDQPAGPDGATVLGDLLVDDRFREEPENLLVLPELVGRLPAREREIVLLRFVEELGQDEIAARVGISQMHVSRLLRRALARLRAQLVEA